jgi:enoyl-CoA hydratase/carnithine racemase
MPRFAVTVDDRRIEIAFDDGGVNLLSSEALRELRSVILSRRSAEGPKNGEESSPVERDASQRGGSSAVLRHSAAPPAQDDTVSGPRVLIFRSSHRHIFAAGADMAEMQRFTPLEAAEFARLGQETFAAIEKLPVATVAIIDGDCFGGALDLVMSFDLRFATPRSRFSHPGARLGIVTGFGGTTRWRKLLEPPAARALFLGNPVLGAADALELGLVDRVGDDFSSELRRLEELDPRTMQFVKELTIHAGRLSRSELRLVAERLRHIYFGNDQR